VVLSAEQDPFFKENMHKNFGDLGIAIKELVDKFQEKAQVTQNITSIGILFLSFFLSFSLSLSLSLLSCLVTTSH
jgi:hypothetical protein